MVGNESMVYITLLDIDRYKALKDFISIYNLRAHARA